MNRKNRTYIYTGNSPILKEYVYLKNKDGWEGWSDSELDSINNSLNGHWIIRESIGSVPKGITITPSALNPDSVIKENNKNCTKFQNVLNTIITYMKRFFIKLFRKLFMEEDFEDGYHREEC